MNEGMNTEGAQEWQKSTQPGHYGPVDDPFAVTQLGCGPSARPEDDCARHRGPQGPNEDIAGFCTKCGRGMFSMRPEGETFGNHLPDCSLPLRHESYCVGGGSGHAPSRRVRG